MKRRCSRAVCRSLKVVTIAAVMAALSGGCVPTERTDDSAPTVVPDDDGGDTERTGDTGKGGAETSAPREDAGDAGPDCTREQEVCDGRDNDCDGETDEELERNCDNQEGVCAGQKTVCTDGSWEPCNPEEYSTHYESDETTCDGRDNDCDGQVDESSKRIVAVAGGSNFSCALDDAGKAYCWGANGSGQLGDGTDKPSERPVAVDTTESFESIDAGDTRACAVTAAGDVYCWGGGIGGSSSPVEVGGSASFDSVTVGSSEMCGMTTDGRALCWEAGSLQPSKASSEHEFSAISAGSRVVCGLDAGGAAWCWGENSWGQLGDGTYDDSFDDPVSVHGTTRYDEISVGGRNTCGISKDDELYCWGLSKATGDSYWVEPRRIHDSSGYRNLVSGWDHACALTDSGAAACWWQNEKGQVDGDAGSVSSRYPTPFETRSSAEFVDVGAGDYHTCVVSQTGTVLCWGLNEDGQLGTGTTTGSNESGIPVCF